MEQIDFFQMMAQQKPSNEAKEEVEEVKEKVEKVKEEPKPKPKKKEAAKKTVKKEPVEKKNKTLEEQIAEVNDALKTPIDRIFKHLMSIPEMDVKMRNPEKSITDMWRFIESKAKEQAKNGTACIEDNVVYGWAVHYYDEDDPR